MISLHELNSLPVAQFVAVLSGIFERSPWVPERVAALRPFGSRLQLHSAMCQTLAAASTQEQLALIRAHPELAGGAAVRAQLTPESTREQKGAGLSACTQEELSTLQALNAAYGAKFGFPFVLAVRGHNPGSVIEDLRRRVNNTIDEERAAALKEIGRIAGIRLVERVSAPCGAEILAMADELAQFSEQEDALTCSYLTTAHRATAEKIRDWMLCSGLQVSIDAVGNVVGRWPAASADARSLLTGSHYDTVINGGKYDGRLGVLLPIAVVAELRRDGVQLPYTLEIIAFAEEEGVRFKSTFLGSRAVAGKFDFTALDSVDAAGISMRDAMRDAGFDLQSIAAVARNPAQLLGFVEVHIEQGPVLLSEDRPVGVVTSIAGSVRALVTVVGLAGHAGTVPMHLRRDAAAAAAEIVLAVERRCKATPGLVGTVGQLQVPQGAVNVIAGRCELSIDIRSDDDGVRDAAYADLAAAIEAIAQRREVTVQVRKVLEIERAPCALGMQQQWVESVRRVTGTSDVRRLPSGAGHDAMVMQQITDIGMLFARCGNGGISHHPDETLSAADADVAARVFQDFLLHFPIADHDHD